GYRQDEPVRVGPTTVAAAPLRVVLRQDPLRDVIGRVVDPHGRPLSGVPLHVTGWAERGRARPLHLNAVTDAGGHFQLRQVPRDYHWSEALAAPGWAWVFRRGQESSPDDPGQTLPDFVVQPLDGQIRGEVVDRRGRPVVGATVVALKHAKSAC